MARPMDREKWPSQGKRLWRCEQGGLSVAGWCRLGARASCPPRSGNTCLHTCCALPEPTAGSASVPAGLLGYSGRCSLLWGVEGARWCWGTGWGEGRGAGGGEACAKRRPRWEGGPGGGVQDKFRQHLLSHLWYYHRL